ncbi:type I-F CRISPR-associated protein Csy3 [Thermithiobacillus tepidarius DSM 3134]|uniref:type I-F CRISPR-associated protein Csy3 n=1 Tax=Thermithiobacillus tepidarius TaxID=929 RepID=UPI0004919C23|nr:type I-F CRISPR-associated protein Csy3 [Thermithiobacillus tepidarius]
MVEINANTQPLKYLPSVLAFRRAVILTDAPLQYVTADNVVKPVPVIRHGTMGTQNVNEAEKKGAATAAEGERDVRNLQEIESAKTGADMRHLQISFQMKTLALRDTLHSCANSAKQNTDESSRMRAMLNNFIERALNSNGLTEVSRRIARNVCNARWIWRNRTLASNVHILVESDGQSWPIDDALSTPMSHFDGYTESEKAIGDRIAAGLRGEKQRVTLNVRAVIDLGVQGAAEVYGSQNYEPSLDKLKKGGLSRSLYKLQMAKQEIEDGAWVVGQAALRDAKVWNALRTIDTWFADYDIVGTPIPVEPMGASLALMRFMRDKKQSAFELFKRLHQIDPNSPEGMYCIASLMRGGVFGDGESGREKSAKAGGEES